MIREIALPATPAMARKLARLSAICEFSLDARMLAAAVQDRIGEDAFDALACQPTPVRMALTQFMLDCGLRVVVPALHRHMDRECVLNAVRLAGASPLTVATHEILPWKRALRGSSLGEDAVFANAGTILERCQDRSRREGVLIIDWQHAMDDGYRTSKLVAMAREFPRTIVYASHREVTTPLQGYLSLPHDRAIRAGHIPWWDMARVLFPQMPYGNFDTGARQSRVILQKPKWTVRHVDDLCVLYNTFLPKVFLGAGIDSPADKSRQVDPA